jgi:hypothetical protein
MSRSAAAAVAVALACVSLGLAGCGGQTAAPSPAQVLHTRLAAMVSARWLTLDGTVSMEGVSYPVTFNEDDQAGANGSITVAQRSVAVTWTGGRLFLRNADYFDTQQVYTGDRWTLVQDNKLASLVGALVDRKALVSALTAVAGPNVRQRSGPTTQGVATILLGSDTLTATVPVRGGPPLRLATALDQKLSDGLADLRLTVAASSAPLSVTPPPTFIDLASKNSLPAQFEEDAPESNPFQWDGCDARGCTLNDHFRNRGGRLGTASVTFEVASGGKTLGSCNVEIPATDNGGTVRAGCRVNFDNSLQVQGRANITNPA